MNFQNLQDLTVYWLDDLNYGYFTPIQVKRWLNNAQLEVQKLLLQAHSNYYLYPVQTTLVVNQADYVLPQDFLKLHRLEVVNSGSPPNEDVSPLSPITLNQQDLVPSHTGTPQFYFLKKSRIKCRPAPDTALTMRLYYSYRVAEMTLSTDRPDVPEEYHEYLPVLAAIDGLIKDGRSIEPLLAKKTYYDTLMRQEAEERQEDAPRSIVTTGSDVVGAFGFF